MKTKLPLVLAAMCAAAMAAGAAAKRPPSSETARESEATRSSPSRNSSSVTKSGSTVLPPALAAEKAREEALRAHVNTADRFKMETPPPAPRTESKPPAPASNYVWVPGHWAPEAGEWKWIAGQWSVPATPASVWIEAKYDRDTKRWSPGYWQPDRPDSYENESPAKDPAPAVK